ncbi:hypothetical protein G6F42_022546 [Rhizopus arrhizus]|nr:hypothetical protein G6F42_022546 [Rhizopus arrhizus]
MRQLLLLHPSCLPLPSAPSPSVRSRASSIYLSPVASVVSEDIDMPEFILEEQEKIDKTVVAAPSANVPFVSDVSPSTVVQSPGPPSVVVSSPTPSTASKMSLSSSPTYSTCETADHNVRGRTSLCRGGNVKTFLEETQPTSGMSNQPIEVEYNLPFRYRPNKRKFKPTIPNRERKKARLYQLYLRHKQRMQKLKNELYPLDNI